MSAVSLSQSLGVWLTSVLSSYVCDDIYCDVSCNEITKAQTEYYFNHDILTCCGRKIMLHFICFVFYLLFSKVEHCIFKKTRKQIFTSSIQTPLLFLFNSHIPIRQQGNLLNRPD